MARMTFFYYIARKIKDFSELVAFEHTIFSSSFILIAMIVASMQKYGVPWCGWEILFLCGLALVSARNFAMGFNRLLDRDIDKANARTINRPSVDGRIGILSLVFFNLLNAFIFIIVSYFINDLALYLSIPFLIILALYSYMKRFSFLAHWVLGVCLALAPIAGVIALKGEVTLWCLLLSIGVLFWVAGFDLLYSLQDMEFDRQHHLHSVPSKFGESVTLWLSRISHMLATTFWCAFVLEADLGLLAYIGVGFSALMLCYQQYLVILHFKNIPKAFFTTNGYLGIVFFVFVLADCVVRSVDGY